MDIEETGTAYSEAHGIDSHGCVVGWRRIGDDVRAFLWTPGGGMTNFPPPADVQGGALGLSPSGELVVGLSHISGRSHATLWKQVQPRLVAIDVKPGDTQNSINLQGESSARVPVAILSDAGFDATDADQATLRLGRTAVSARRNESLFASAEDVDADGDLDLVVHFDRNQLVASGDLTQQTTELVLTGALVTGPRFQGVDKVTPVP